MSVGEAGSKQTACDGMAAVRCVMTTTDRHRRTCGLGAALSAREHGLSIFSSLARCGLGILNQCILAGLDSLFQRRADG